jgi:hypothetical protein
MYKGMVGGLSAKKRERKKNNEEGFCFGLKCIPMDSVSDPHAF